MINVVLVLASNFEITRARKLCVLLRRGCYSPIETTVTSPSPSSLLHIGRIIIIINVIIHHHRHLFHLISHRSYFQHSPISPMHNRIEHTSILDDVRKRVLFRKITMWGFIGLEPIMFTLPHTCTLVFTRDVCGRVCDADLILSMLFKPIVISFYWTPCDASRLL